MCRWYAILGAVVTAAGTAVNGYEYNRSDFAFYVDLPGNYVEGDGVPWDFISFDDFNDPFAAGDRPTIDTTGDNDFTSGTGSAANPVPVVPVYQPFRAFEIVSIGKGGHLILEFDHHVLDDPLNPCGVDFIIFGNSNMIIDGISRWRNGDPNQTLLQGPIAKEPATVSVSQDGVTWYTFVDGPFADDFAPTLGRIYDPAGPVSSLPGNQWWGQPTDPTYPLSPDLHAPLGAVPEPTTFSAWTLAGLAMKYGYSAGGTGFDLAALQNLPVGPHGLRWFRYVRIDNPIGSGCVPEIDAVADVAPRLVPDLDCDSDVDGADVDRFEECASGPGVARLAQQCVRADFDQDGDVDQTDFGFLQRCITGPDVLLDWDCMN